MIRYADGVALTDGDQRLLGMFAEGRYVNARRPQSRSSLDARARLERAGLIEIADGCVRLTYQGRAFLGEAG